MSSKTMLQLSSNPRNVSQVEAFLQNVIEDYKISPDRYGNILISLTEAVNNAIIHGNRQDENKCVKIHCEKRNRSLAFRVSDEGRGFDYSNVPDPTSPENLLKIGGRGVFLIRQLSDRVNYFNNGSTVEIHFNID
jgi:serine/threonine-protein kinase RsbW